MVKKEIDITRWTEEEEDIEGEEGGRRENGSKDAERKKNIRFRHKGKRTRRRRNRRRRTKETRNPDAAEVRGGGR